MGRRALLAVACLGALAVLTSCSGAVADTVSTAAEDSASAIATARLAIRQDADGKLTRAATSTALDDALKEVQSSRDTVLRLSPASPEDRQVREDALKVLDSSAAGLSTARDAVSSDDGGPSLSDGAQALAAAEEALNGLKTERGREMKRLLGVALGILTAIGGFVDIGDLVTNAVVGSRFGLSLIWVVAVGVVGICVFANMSGRVAAASGRATFEVIRERLGPRAGLANLSASFLINLMTVTAGDRRHRAGPAAGQQRQLPAVDSAGGGGRVAGDLAGQVLHHGERHRAPGLDPDRVRGGTVPAQTGLGQPGQPGHPRGPGRGNRRHLLVLRHRPVRRRHDARMRCSFFPPALWRRGGRSRT
jgi:hypothetical protein